MQFDEESMKEFIKEFVFESLEHLENIEDDVLKLTRVETAADSELVNKIYRAVHSVKGGAGFLNLEKIQTLSHIIETVMSFIREGSLQPGPEVVDALLAGTDLLTIMLAEVDKSNFYDISRVSRQLQGLIDEKGAQKNLKELKTQIRVTEAEDEIPLETNRFALNNLPSDHRFLYIVHYDLIKLANEEDISPLDLIRRLLDSGEILDSNLKPCQDDLGPGLPDRELIYSILYSTFLSPQKIKSLFLLYPDSILILDKEKLREEDIILDIRSFILSEEKPGEEAETIRDPEETVSFQKAPEDKEETAGISSPSLKTDTDYRSPHPVKKEDVRVGLDKLDELVDLVGELVIAETLVTRNGDLAGMELENFETSAHNLRRIISEMHEVVMDMRMVPLNRTFRKTVRLTRDLGIKMGKKIKLKIVGEDTEIDRSVLEHLSDPLIHVVRNSIDHGIETPEIRKAKGKTETGEILVEGNQEGGEVRITVSDDGKGLDRERILSKAKEAKLVSEDANKLADHEVYRLIFEPGFTTAGSVTELSGRGVGMDVVKRNIEKINGRVEVHSVYDQGTSVVIRIPLTMAIIDSMMVEIGETTYAIPFSAISECFEITREEAKRSAVRNIVEYRGNMLPYMSLRKFFNLNGLAPDYVKILVAEVKQRKFCIGVDRIVDKQQIVIKSLSKLYRNFDGVSGATIMGDGSVALILDVGKIFESQEIEEKRQ